MSSFLNAKFTLIKKHKYYCKNLNNCFRLRNMNWKRISLVDRYDKQLEDSENVSSFCRFQHEEFEEKNFAVHGGRDYHMDLGLFFKFLQEHELQQVFQILFGVEGKPPSEVNKKS